MLGVFLLLGIAAIRFGAGYDRIGPRFFPSVVGIGLVLLGALLAWEAFRAHSRIKEVPQEVSAPLNRRALGYLGAALLLNLALLERAGFVIACSSQFWLAARAFHSARPVRDAVVAVLLSVIVYLAFSQLLGLDLPAGILGNLF